MINLGNTHTVTLAAMIAGLERALGLKARIQRFPEQPGDVPRTWASIDKAKRLLAYEPRTPFGDGLRHFAEWMGAETARALPRAQ